MNARRDLEENDAINNWVDGQLGQAGPRVSPFVEIKDSDDAFACVRVNRKKIALVR